MIWSIYDPTTGLITSRVRNRNQIRDRSHIAGDWDPLRYHVINGRAQLLPSKPMIADHVILAWDNTQQQWIVNQARTQAAARNLRADKLARIDRINPIWWADLSNDQQQQAMAYRQALLDVTDQPGWPTQIEWPAAPAWL